MTGLKREVLKLAVTVAALSVFGHTPLVAQQVTAASGAPNATTTLNGLQLPPPPAQFGGKIETTADESTQW